MSWSWSAEEDQAMDYLPHAAQVLYLRVLRRRMDFNTGVVGITCRISYQQIGEWLEVRPPPKSTKPIVRLTVGEIRAALAQLERAGLIVRIDRAGEAMPLVFSMPFAKTGLVREKYERQDERQQISGRATGIDDAEKNEIALLFSSSNSKTYTLKMAVDNLIENSQKRAMNDSKKSDERQDERQTSGKSSTSLNNKYITARIRGNGFPIAEDWLPGVETVERMVLEFGLPPTFLKTKALEFRILWRDQNVIAMNWDSYFYGACKNRLAERDGEFVTAQNNSSGGGCE